MRKSTLLAIITVLCWGSAGLIYAGTQVAAAEARSSVQANRGSVGRPESGFVVVGLGCEGHPTAAVAREEDELPVCRDIFVAEDVSR